MQTDDFAERLARIRARFAATLESKVAALCRNLPHLSGSDAGVHDRVAEAYREVHKLRGVAATVGFAATGTAARGAEDALLLPFQSRRGLTAGETELLRKALAALRAAAQSELQSMPRGAGHHVAE